MLYRAGLLVFITSILVGLCFVQLGLIPMAKQLASDQFDVAVVRVETGLLEVFAPPVSLLDMSRGWLDGQVPDLATPRAFNQIFEPVLKGSPQLTAVAAGTSSGQGWFLLQQDDGSWRNRMTDIPRWGQKHHLLIDSLPNGEVIQSWSDQTYDPRERPWFKGALVLPPHQMVYWTEPYTFLTTGDLGITAASHIRMTDGRDFVLGFDLTLRDLSATTLHATVGRHGMALVMTDDERVLAMPAAPLGVTEVQWLKQVLKPATALGLGPLKDGLDSWRNAAKQSDRVLGYTSDGERWLLSARPQFLGGQKFWVVVLAPEKDFAPAWLSIAWALGLVFLLIGALTLWLIRTANLGMIQPLEELAQASRRIGQLDFQTVSHSNSQVAEIQELDASQKTVLAILRDNHDELNARAEALSCQVAMLKSTESRLQKQNDQLSTIIENFPGGVSVVDANLRFLAHNCQFKSLLGLPDAMMEDSATGFKDVIRFKARRGDYGPGDVETLVTDRISQVGQWRVHRMESTLPNGTVLEVRGMPLPQGGYVTLYIDVTLVKKHEHELEQLAHFDALTGLPNRVLLADRLRQAMLQATRRNQQLAVAYLDLDGFKIVNDTHGHEVGDQLLLTVARHMKQALRDGDTLARLGGDEFVAVLLDVSGLDGSAPMLRRLLKAADTPVMVGGRKLQLSASAGVTFFPQKEEVDAEQLLRQADQAMYQAKQAGKNRYHVFDAEHDISLRGQLEGVQRLRDALIKGEFVLYYQPKVNMRTSEVKGVEALIRWQHPERGLLAPAAFLPLIDDHPMSVDIGQWVINAALTQMSTWMAAGLHLPISVNLGARQLQQSGFVENLRAALAVHPEINPQDLMLEVLETSALEDMALVTAVMDQCRAMGVHYALDDFGTGYSSLTYLKRLPVSQLKIDQSFVRDMLGDPDDLSILVGVLDLSSSFHRQVIAEGVETVAHGQMLLQLGCELAQGYGIARPMPAQDLPTWVAGWRGEVLWHDIAVLPRRYLPLLIAGVEHRSWVTALESFLIGERSGVPPLDAHLCQFGQRVAAGEFVLDAGSAATDMLISLHQDVHRVGAHLCELKIEGQQEVALQQLVQQIVQRDKLLAHLAMILQEVRT